MSSRIPASQHIINILVAVCVTAILAFPVAWLLLKLTIEGTRAVRYQTTSFPPFALIFVSEQPTQERLGGDFALHPALFERDGNSYSAEIDTQSIQFTTVGNLGITDYVCNASLNKQPLDCEQIAYFSDPGMDFFIRFSGDLGIDSVRAAQLNAPHFTFVERLNTLRRVLFILIPIGLCCGVWFCGKKLLAWRTPHFYPSNVQIFYLFLPWGAGLLGWTLIRAMIEYAFS